MSQAAKKATKSHGNLYVSYVLVIRINVYNPIYTFLLMLHRVLCLGWLSMLSVFFVFFYLQMPVNLEK